MGKILHFSACRGEEYFTAPHNTSRRGGFSFIPVPSRPPGEAKLALLGPISAQAVKNSPNTLKTPQNQRFFASRANFFSVSPRIHTCWRVFSRRWVPQTPHSTRQPPRLKQMTPMRVDHCHKMKPPAPLRAPRRTRLKPLTPLLAQNSQIQAIFRPQRCHGFHAPLAEHPQRRRRFHQTPNQVCWFTARRSDAHACCRRGGPDSVGAVRQ